VSHRATQYQIGGGTEVVGAFRREKGFQKGVKIAVRPSRKTLHMLL